MDILCTLRNLNLSFGDKILFKNAAFTIHHNERIGLLGLNGTGKSCLFKILCGKQTADTSIPPFEFTKATGKGNNEKSYSAFLVPQSLPLKQNDPIIAKDYIYRFYPLLDEIHNELLKTNIELEKTPNASQQLLQKQKNLLDKFEHANGWKITQSFESYLKFFSLKDPFAKVINLSGGEQKKILLALGFSCPSNLILWDEPTNHIDIDTISLFEKELSDSKKTFMIVTHDRHLLTRVTNRILHIKQGLIEGFEGSYTTYLQYLENKEEERKKLLTRLNNTLRREDAWMKQGIKARGTRSKKRVENLQHLKSNIDLLKNAAKKEINLNINHSKRKTKILIDFKDVSFSYDKDIKIFKKINFTIRKQDKIGLLGPNGIGKTTLFKLMEGSLIPDDGNIRKADNLNLKHFCQKRENLNPNKTPFEVLGNGTDQVILPDGRGQHVIAYFESFLFKGSEIHRPLKTFSGGELNRLQMALNLTKSSDIYFFDEPTNDLDLETLELLEKKLSTFQGAMVLISHDRTFLNNVTDKVWLIQNKELEQFEASYGHVENYLETIRLEQELLEAEEKLTTSIKEPKQTRESKSKKLTNKEKIRLKTIGQDIEKIEQSCLKVEQLLNDFDYSNMGKNESKELNNLNTQKEELELELLELYEEVEDLKSKTK